jgi:hypothetical protein
MGPRFSHQVGLTVVADDLPEQDDRVDLDSSTAASSGIPAARVSYSLSDNTKKLLDHGSARARKVLMAAGAVEVLDPGNATMAHLMGTARKGIRPDRSAVDTWNRAPVTDLHVVRWRE